MSASSKNYLTYTLILTAFVVSAIVFLAFMPERFWEKYDLKPIDIFSDIRTKFLPSSNTIVSDSLQTTVPDSCKTGIVCFEDYSPNKNGLHRFLNALGDNSHAVRIAFFGDSFIEGDIFSGDLRELLQGKFGGKGVGMMPVTSPGRYFRRTVSHDFSDTWTAISQPDAPKTSDLGINGKAFIPKGNSRVYYADAKRKSDGDTCQRVSIFYKLTAGENNVSYTINKSTSGEIKLRATGKLERADILNDSISNITLNFPGNPALTVYGISLENNTGVILDNFSTRGTPGTNLQSLPQENLKRTDSLCHYDLIVLEYGLNVAGNKVMNYDNYRKEMGKTVRYLQECFPHTDFLLLSVSDRSMKQNGNYETMPCIPAMVAAQQQICADNGIVFWNLFEAMGGEKSMVSFVESTPPKANKDYTHLTFEGGKHLANILYETILYEKERLIPRPLP